MNLNLAVVLFWLILMFGVGIYAGVRHPIRTFEGWATGERSLGYIVNYFTAHATQVSALTYMGFVAFLYQFGPVFYYSHYITYMLTTTAFFVLFSPRLWRLGKQLGHVTPTDLLAYYYNGGPKFRYLVGAVLLLALIPYIQLQVIAGGYLFQLAIGSTDEVSFWTGAILLYLIVGIYLLVGGLRAVAWTDVLQGILLFLGIWVGALLIIFSLGGGPGNIINAMVSQRPEIMHITGFKGWDYGWVISWGIALGFGWAFHAHMFLRNYTAKSEWDARTWPHIMFTVNVLNGIVLLFAAMALAIAVPGKAGAEADRLFLSVIGDQFPPLVYAFMIAGALGSMLSTLDSQTHAVSVVITRDFVDASGKSLTERQAVALNRSVVAIALAFGLLLAWLLPAPLTFVGAYAASLGLLLAPAVLIALTGQRWATRSGVVAGLVAGLVALLAVSTGPFLNPGNIYFGFWGLIVNVVVLVLVSLATRREAPAPAVVELVRATPA